MADARGAATAYLAAVNDHDRGALVGLFAPDAVAVNPFGTFQGREAILGFYDEFVFANDVTVEATNVVDAGTTCVVELDGRTPAIDEVQHMVDLFTVGADGRVTRLAIYRR
jgi:hypothetical protein